MLINENFKVELSSEFNFKLIGKEDNENYFAGVAMVLGKVLRNNLLFYPGCFSAEVLNDFDKTGFYTAYTHNTNTEPVGYPTSTKMVGYALTIEGNFHTTQHAQNVRTIYKERLEEKKSIGLSTGGYGRAYYFASGEDALEDIKSRGIDLKSVDTEQIKNSRDIYAFPAITSLEHICFTLVPADTDSTIKMLNDMKENNTNLIKNQINYEKLKMETLKMRHNRLVK